MFAIDILPLVDSEHHLPERFFRGQPSVIIGSDLECQLQHPLLRNLNFNVLIQKLAGSQFECRQIFHENSDRVGFQDIYESTAKLNLGTVKILITSIDADLLVKENEAPDQAGYRLLKQAVTSQLTTFPALEINKPYKAVVSFNPDQVLTVGRADYHHLVIEQFDVSSDHARFGFANNKYWVEDLGSTNGTFLNNQQVSGKIFFEPGDSVLLGASTKITGLKKVVQKIVESVIPEQVSVNIPQESDQLQTNSLQTSYPETEVEDHLPTEELSLSRVEELLVDVRYPVLLAVNKIARPGRLILKKDQTVLIGRDAKSDLWLGAPYVSREHNQITYLGDGEIRIQDHSSNGTAYSEGMIPAGGELLVSNKSEILHYGSGLAVALCFNQEDEEIFVASGGRADAFIENLPTPIKEQVSPLMAPKTATSSKEKTYRPLRSNDVVKNGVVGKILYRFLSFDIKRKVFICCLSLLVIAIFVLLISIILTFL